MEQLRTGGLVVTALIAMYACKSGGGASAVRDADMPDNIVTAPVDPDCAGYADAVGDPLVWLLHDQNQKALEKIFNCAPPSKALPSGFGIGRGSVYQAGGTWNYLQAKVGTYLWGGKRLYQQPDGETCLLNQMEDSKTERYMAHVYLTSSNRDNKPVVVLDYRGDKTVRHPWKQLFKLLPAQIAVDKIAKGIRDEIREITQNGVGTKVYIGRANIYKAALVGGDLSNISDADFADPKKYIFGANFFLDFRDSPDKPATFGTETPTCFDGGSTTGGGASTSGSGDSSTSTGGNSTSGGGDSSTSTGGYSTSGGGDSSTSGGGDSTSTSGYPDPG